MGATRVPIGRTQAAAIGGATKFRDALSVILCSKPGADTQLQILKILMRADHRAAAQTVTRPPTREWGNFGG
jgi:hypothetical protein